MMVLATIYAICTVGWTVFKIQSFQSKAKRKEAGLYGFLMAICLVAGFCYFIHKQLPSTTLIVRLMFEPIGKWLLSS